MLWQAACISLMVPWRSARSLVRARWFTVGNGTEPHGAALPAQEGGASASPLIRPAYLWRPGARWAGPEQSPGVQGSAGSVIWQGCAGRWTSRPPSWWSSAASDPQHMSSSRTPLDLITWAQVLSALLSWTVAYFWPSTLPNSKTHKLIASIPYSEVLSARMPQASPGVCRFPGPGLWVP